jgi:hypothetical protein
VKIWAPISLFFSTTKFWAPIFNGRISEIQCRQLQSGTKGSSTDTMGILFLKCNISGTHGRTLAMGLGVITENKGPSINTKES